MPLADIRLINGVLTPDQKKTIIKNVTDAMVSVRSQAMRPVTLGARAGDRKWRIGDRRKSADDV